MKKMSRLLYSRNQRTFCGQPVQQTWASFFLLERMLINEKNIGWIFEIGTGSGGLSMYLASNAHVRGIPFATLDYINRMSSGCRFGLDSLGATVMTCDSFGLSTVPIVKAFVSSRPGLLICDGGDKPLEGATFGKACAPGSLVCLHDRGREWRPEDVNLSPCLVQREDWDKISVLMGTTMAVYQRVATDDE